MALLYYTVKLILRVVFRSGPGVHRLMRSAYASLETLTRQYGGSLRQFDSHTLQWEMPSGGYVQIRRRSHPTIHVHIPLTPGYSMNCQRIPRLLYAFVDAFLHEDSHIGTLPYYISSNNRERFHELKNRPEFLRLFARLSKEKYSITLNASGLKASKRLSMHEANDVILFEQIRLLKDFGALCVLRNEIPVQPVNSVSRCAYCHEEGQDLICCSTCLTPHHQECFQLNGSCSVFGCGSVQSNPPEVIHAAAS